MGCIKISNRSGVQVHGFTENLNRRFVSFDGVDMRKNDLRIWEAPRPPRLSA
jgi:hypothetical protein